MKIQTGVNATPSEIVYQLCDEMKDAAKKIKKDLKAKGKCN